MARRPAALAALALVFAIAPPLRADEQRHRQRAREILAELVGLDTTHRVGTGEAVARIAARLHAAGFPDADVVVAGPRPERANLVARLRGASAGVAVLFLSHLDVVEAVAEDWSPGLDPFHLTERDGFYYGRGTVDVKDEAALLVTNLIRLKEEGFVPAADVVVALTADEEGGGENGVAWLLENRPDLLQAPLCINTDAGGGQLDAGGGRVRYTFQTGEKISVGYELVVRSPGGHSSMPVRDNAIYHLAAGLSRLAAFDFPIALNQTTQAFLARMADREQGGLAADLRAASASDPAALARVAQASPFYNGILRTTCVATMLEGGHARNALPQLARATLNCRLLPGQSAADVRQALEGVVADPRIEVAQQGEARDSPASPLDPRVLGAVERIAADLWPGVPVIPVMDPWSSDGAQMRRAGIPTYGAPGAFYENDPNRAHGQDERIGVASYLEGLEFNRRLMLALAGSGAAVSP